MIRNREYVLLKGLGEEVFNFTTDKTCKKYYKVTYVDSTYR